MYKAICIILLCITFARAETITLVSNNTNWKQSTVVQYNDTIPWTGVSVLPDISTYTLTPTLGGTHVGSITGATNLYSGNGIRFYYATFNLNNFSSITADLRISVDNDVHIFINNKFVALEGSLDGSNFDGNPSRIYINNTGAITNGYAGGQAFDSTALTFAASNWLVGTNTIILAVRNLSGGDSGGLTFRMDVNTVSAVPEPSTLFYLSIFLLWTYNKKKRNT